MRGTRAKAIRREVYSREISGKTFRLDFRDREYEYVDPPLRHRSLNQTCIADDLRYLYQSMKGRRSFKP